MTFRCSCNKSESWCAGFRRTNLRKSLHYQKRILTFVSGAETSLKCDIDNYVLMKRRTASNGVLNHCYQRVVQDELLFFSVSDYLVFFTIISVMVRKFKIRLLSLCLMIDHYHMSAIASGTKNLSDFISACTWTYAREINPVFHRSGQLFRHNYGSAPKKGSKSARTNIIYVGNNPVERRIVKNAEDYRWNFLKYAISKNPFSEPLVIRKASWPLRKALNEVKLHFKAGRYLTPAILKRLSSSLDKSELAQLTDYIISTYNAIDYETAINHFGSYDNMIHSMHATTGSEHDLNELFIGKSDAHYPLLIKQTMKKAGLNDIHDLFNLPEEERYDLLDYLCRHSDADSRQIAALLRIKVKFNEGMREMQLPDNQ